MDLTLFDPTIPSEPAPLDYAPRPEKLDRLKIVLVENTKHNSKALLLRLFERLKSRYQVELLDVFKKQSAGHPISESDIALCKGSADIALAGIGD